MAYQAIPLDLSNQTHREGLLRLWAQNMSDSAIAGVAEQRLRWFYEGNPTEPPRTILSTYGQPTEVIGCGSTFTRRMWVGDRIALAGIPCDFAVAKRHRIGGAALGIQQQLIAASRATGQEFLFGFPNKLSLPILKRVGYEVVAEARAWVKPLRSIYKVRERIKNPLLARAASLAVDAGLRALDAATAPPWDRRFRDEILDRADDRFDRLWESARSGYRIIGEKTSAFLNWRYAGFTTRRHRFYALTEAETGALAGYVVYTVENEKVFLQDMFARDLDRLLAPLVIGFARAMRRAGHLSIFVSYAGDPSLGARLERLWFAKSKHRERSLVVLVHGDAAGALAADLRTARNWLMFDGEMDI